MIRLYATLGYYECRPYQPMEAILLPASSWARRGLHIRPCLPPTARYKAADCGGFVATRIWGDYRYTPSQYVDWLGLWDPDWAATMDYCCEDEITAGRPGLVCERQAKTTAMAYHFWHTYRDCPWVWVPTIQGWILEDYRRHAAEMAPLVAEMAAHYAARGSAEFRVGIGTLCRRADSATIRAIVRAVARELPGVGFHLWGIKLDALQTRVAFPASVASVDTAAFGGEFATRRRSREWAASGLSRRKWIAQVVWPEYAARFAAAQAQPKQTEMDLV